MLSVFLRSRFTSSSLCIFTDAGVNLSRFAQFYNGHLRPCRALIILISNRWDHHHDRQVQPCKWPHQSFVSAMLSYESRDLDWDVVPLVLSSFPSRLPRWSDDLPALVRTFFLSMNSKHFTKHFTSPRPLPFSSTWSCTHTQKTKKKDSPVLPKTRPVSSARVSFLKSPFSFYTWTLCDRSVVWLLGTHLPNRILISDHLLQWLLHSLLILR